VSGRESRSGNAQLAAGMLQQHTGRGGAPGGGFHAPSSMPGESVSAPTSCHTLMEA
jgi:hypothetical protein